MELRWRRTLVQLSIHELLWKRGKDLSTSIAQFLNGRTLSILLLAAGNFQLAGTKFEGSMSAKLNKVE